MLATLFCVVAGVSTAAQNIQFEDRTAPAGIDYTGESWGGAWGDFNGDGFFDFWATNHGGTPFLLLNQQDGTFQDRAQDVLPTEVLDYYASTPGSYDMHGAVWVDIDKDGDMDLFQSADGGIRLQPNHLYINANGFAFSAEVAADAGVDLPGMNATMPLAYDWNTDGLTDLFAASNPRSAGEMPVNFFERIAGGIDFQDVTAGIAIDFPGPTKFGRVTDLDNDGIRELLVGPTPDSLRAYEFAGPTPTDITAQLALGGYVDMVDAVVADFDGDLDDDLFIVRGESTLEVTQASPTRAEASVSVFEIERGISFRTTGEVEIEFFPIWQVPLSTIYVGAGGYRPDAIRFTLSPDDPANHGIAPHTPGEIGHYVGYDPATETWTVLVSDDGYAQRNITVDASMEITELQAIGFVNDQNVPSDTFLANVDGSFVDETILRGFTEPTSGRSIGAGDFDNDGDVDLYVVSTGAVENKPNRLYVNDGNGVFTLQTDGGGAAGGTEGRGDAVAVADYDNDGFLDLIVTNGKDRLPFYLDGPYYLFRNLGNANNWLQLDLVGTQSPTSGTGAIVEILAGTRSQRRMQGGGVHYRSQDMQRLHFGLGSDDVVTHADVYWPSGAVQRLAAIPANQIVTLTEPLTQIDSDGDGLLDDVDNCTAVANELQTDSDEDGFGDRCDTDVNNDCITNTLDLGLLKTAFFSSDPLIDFDGSGLVNVVDLGIMKAAFFDPPGPSGTSMQCAP